MKLPLWLTLCLILLLAGCATAPTPTPIPAPPHRPGPTPRPTVASGGDVEAIQALVQMEGDLVVSQDIEGLMALWTDDAMVRDAKNTPDDESDDAVWKGKDAIRNRYVVLVFPGAAKSNVHADMDVQV